MNSSYKWGCISSLESCLRVLCKVSVGAITILMCVESVENRRNILHYLTSVMFLGVQICKAATVGPVLIARI